LENDEWKYDRIPEIIDGKNIADFIDIDIEQKLEALEREEAERLRQRPSYLEDSDVHDHAIMFTTTLFLFLFILLLLKILHFL
jgi:nucleolar GTP-binding protein